MQIKASACVILSKKGARVRGMVEYRDVQFIEIWFWFRLWKYNNRDKPINALHSVPFFIGVLGDYSRNPRRLCNKWTLTFENENTCATANWIRTAFKVTAGYIPAADCVLNQTTKAKDKITNYSWNTLAIKYWIKQSCYKWSELE